MTALLQECRYAIEEVDAAHPEWESFAADRTDCFFCMPAWSRVLDAGYGISTRVYLFRQNGKIVLGLPAAVFNFGWFRLIHGYTPYGEFVGDQSLVPVFLKMLEAYLPQKKISQIRITRRHYETYEVSKSYRIREDCLQVVDLSGCTEASLLSGYKKNARRDVRIGQRAGIRTQVLRSTEEIDCYYTLYCKTMKRKRAFGPHPRQLYHEIQKTFSRDRAIFLGAYSEEVFIGGVILIFWKDTVYLLGNVSDPDYHSICPNDFLIHASLTFAAEKGYRYFDLMTTGESYKRPSKLSAFKEKWGAVRYPFIVYEKDLHPWRCVVWNYCWQMANTPVGSAILRFFVNR